LARPAKSPPLPDAAQPAALQGLGRIALHQRTLPTRYTGQYIYANDFGLVFYNARWDDPLLASWAQPDTLIPQNQGTQAWDRYAYVNN